jgi:DNA-binding transcriptional LysR family regulator
LRLDKPEFVLDIRKLNMLAELDRLGTIAAVAKQLNLTAPGISMQLATLEREVGLKLTEKQGRRIIVTPAGHMLAKHGSSIVDMLTVAEMEAASLRDGAAGTYRIAAFPTAARAILPAAWNAIVSQQDLGVDLRLEEREPSEAIAALAAGEVELAVAHWYSNMPPIDEVGLVVRDVGSERVWLAVNDAAFPATGDEVALADFAAHDWIVPGHERTCYEMVERACELAGFTPHAVANATDFRVQLALVGAGIGVALVPELGAIDPPAGVRLLALREPIFRHIVLVSRRGSAADAGLGRIQDAIAAEAQLVTSGERG